MYQNVLPSYKISKYLRITTKDIAQQEFRESKEDEQITQERLIDELFLCLINVKAIFCLINFNGILDPVKKRSEENNNIGRGVLRRKYEEYAKYLLYRIPVFRPAPFFIVNVKDLTPNLKKELVALMEYKESMDYVMKETIGRIFAEIDERYFLLSVRKLLRWKLEK